MSKNKAEPTADAEPKRGRTIVLPDGTKRVDYIRKRYYEDGATRSVIAKELSELQGKVVPYQIVFASTKEKRPGDGDGATPAEGANADPESAAA